MCQYSLHIKCYSIQSFISALRLVFTQKAIFSLRLKLNVTRQFHTHALCMELISCGILWKLGLFPDLEYFIGFSSTWINIILYYLNRSDVSVVTRLFRMFEILAIKTSRWSRFLRYRWEEFEPRSPECQPSKISAFELQRLPPRRQLSNDDHCYSKYSPSTAAAKMFVFQKSPLASNFNRCHQDVTAFRGCVKASLYIATAWLWFRT